MRSAQEAAPASDMLGLAILTALNLADEAFRSRQRHSTGHDELNQRALQLEQLVDEALAQVSE
jgi:cell division protein ZapA (FtsZ GTPase activity inhibitor)